MGEIDVAFEGSGNDEEDNLPALNETSTPVDVLTDSVSMPNIRTPDIA